ncbi:hypothetical protein GCM10017559_76890 [Streptosporangium longisporum]|uniref:Uncharacterized protein n=1 Tax=Streptosporangium longisporum TaxID=46187 RepID=A0ABP6LFG2_9ACTN
MTTCTHADQFRQEKGRECHLPARQLFRVPNTERTTAPMRVPTSVEIVLPGMVRRGELDKLRAVRETGGGRTGAATPGITSVPAGGAR